jgi:antitoxin component of RelBE/YafQ-DinJ toxin-antitoxin module
MSERQSVTFSDQAMAELREDAKRIGITVSDLVRRIVDQYREAKGLP